MKRIFAVWAGRMTSPMSGDGPWGGGDGEGGRGKDGPRNPWTPPESGNPGGPGSRGPSAIDELIRRARNSFGGSGPDGPSLRKLWPYAVLGIVAIWILTTSIQRIGPQQRGLVTLFGSYVRTLGPGVNFTLPAPIESVDVIDVDEIRTMDLGSAGDESQKLMLTEDQNIINLGYSVRWNISNPEFYAFQIADPEKTIEQVAESAMRAVIATVSLQDAIGAGRNAIEQQVQEHMQTILDSYGAGIRIQGVAIKQADPPEAVNDAFKQVTAAQQAAET
jgi:membrane protease subunit HflK